MIFAEFSGSRVVLTYVALQDLALFFNLRWTGRKYGAILPVSLRTRINQLVIRLSEENYEKLSSNQLHIRGVVIGGQRLCTRGIGRR